MLNCLSPCNENEFVTVGEINNLLVGVFFFLLQHSINVNLFMSLCFPEVVRLQPVAFYFCAYLGLCGGSASGKTTVANKIIEALDVPWVVLLSMDSFYKVCLFACLCVCVTICVCVCRCGCGCGTVGYVWLCA